MQPFRLVAVSLTFLTTFLTPMAQAQSQSEEPPIPQGSKARSEPRILGGINVGPGQGPWAASMQYQHIDGNNDTWRHFCAGSFVHPRLETDEAGSTSVRAWDANRTSPRWLITAAHCIRNDDGTELDIGRIHVVGGSTNRGSIVERQSVEAALIHEEYNSDTIENDIALLRLAAPTTDFDRTQRSTIRLPSVGDTEWINEDYLAVIAQGWGTNETGSDSLLLKEVVLPLVSRQLCAEKFAIHGETISNGMMCAGFVSGFYDSCQGDSGGPLIYQHRGNLGFGRSNDAVLLGVISWGKGCGNADLFGVYTRMSAYVDWAEGQVIAFASRP